MTKLAFWIHQIVEFALGVVLLTEGARSGRPAVPMTAGVVVLAVAVTGDGPLQALGKFPRKMHRTFDLVAAGVIGLAAAIPIGWANTTGRVVMGVIAGLWLLLIWRTNYRPRPVRVRRAARRAAAARRAPVAPVPPAPRPTDEPVAAGPWAPPGVAPRRVDGPNRLIEASMREPVATPGATPTSPTAPAPASAPAGAPGVRKGNLRRHYLHRGLGDIGIRPKIGYHH